MNEEREQELREDAETGRRYKIAMEVWREFLDSRRKTIVEIFENNTHETMEDGEIQGLLAELRVMKSFRDVSYMNIRRGEIAEEEISNGE